jgi:tetratricopeptide (TPR) repeat protein
VVKSLQDILKQRRQEDFVGREEQLTFFEENLRRPPDDPRHRFVISVSGPGGVGKTWLLRRFRRIAEEQGAVTAWTDELQENVPEVMGCLAEQFPAQDHSLNKFLPTALSGFVAAWDASADLARDWAEAVHQAGVDRDAASVQSWGKRLVKGLDAYRGDEYSDVLAFLTALLDEVDLGGSQRASVLARRGVTYRLMERYDEALADFNRAIELEPDEDWYYSNRALTYWLTGQKDQAQHDLAIAIQRAREVYQKKPQDWRNTLNLALYRLAAGEASEAERLYGEALASGASAYRVREALHDLDDLLALFPDHPQAQAMRDLLQAHLEETER